MRRNKEEGMAQSGDRQTDSESESYPNALTSPIKSDLEVQGQRERGGRALPVIALISLLGLFLSSATGIVFFALGGLESIIARSSELPSRVVVLAASVIGALYSLIHVWAARTAYRKKEHGSPQMYGNYLHAIGLLLLRVELPVWITAIVTTVLAVAKIGLNVSAPFRIESSQTVYINLLLSATGLLSNIALLCCVEWSMTPFATSLISKSDFLADRGRSPTPTPPPSSDPLSPAPYVDRYRSLNTMDRATGAWPSQGLVEPANAPRATHTSLAPPASTMPPTTAVREAGPMVIQDAQRSPVHMSWRPPSHRRKRSVDTSGRGHSRSVSNASATVSPDALPADLQPKLPDVFVMSHQDWRSMLASHSMPSSPTGGSRMAGQSRPSTSAARPSTSAAARQRVPVAIRPSTSAGPASTGPRIYDATLEHPVPMVAQASFSPKYPSPRARSLRSHPPFGAPLILPELPRIAPPPLPPVLTRQAGGDLPVVRPRTAPGIPSAAAGGFGNSIVKRKPVGSQASVKQAPRLEDYSTEESDGDDDDDDDDDRSYLADGEVRLKRSGSGMSRTARRIQKAKIKEREELKRMKSVNQNFSRPLQRSRSLTSLRQQ